MTPQYAFLAACLGGQTPRSVAAICNPESLFALAASEAVLPAIYPRLAANEIPSAISEPLFAVTELNRERNAFILSEAHRVVLLFNKAGIEPIALKGLAYLLAGVYPDPAERYLLDLDFLIPEPQLPLAIQLLADAGYKSESVDRVSAFRHHLPQMWRSDTVPVELHRCIGLGLPSRILSAAEIISASTQIDWDGALVRVPSPEHLVTHLILHSQVRHSYHERIWPSLRAMYDLQLLDHRFAIDWSSVNHRFSVRSQIATLKLHLLHVEQILGMPRPFPITLNLSEKLRWRRRQLLNRWPSLRFVDPVYLVLSTLSRRLRLLRSILSTPGGWKSALQTLLNFGFYRRLLGDITLNGQGNS